MVSKILETISRQNPQENMRIILRFVIAKKIFL